MSFDTPFNIPFGGSPAAPPGPQPAPAPMPPSPTWTLAVNLAGQDVSASLTGAVEIEAEESTARTAKFTLKPNQGVVDVRAWIAAPVEIYYAPGVGSTELVFTGAVVEPVYDPESRLVTFSCSDQLQQYFEAKDESEIIAELGGYYDDQVFGPRRDGWTQAEDVLSTMTAAADLARDGTTLNVTGWDAAVSSDYAYSATNARFIEVELIRLRELVNSVTIDSQYRYTREHHREHQFLWQYNGLCDFLTNPYELPTRDMIGSAAFGIEWINKQGGVCFRTLPDSGTYCGGENLAITPEAQELVATEATWRGVRRWTQTITEDYQLTIQESGSVAGYGVRIQEDGAGRRIDNDDAAWDASLNTAAPGGPSGGGIGGYTVRNCGVAELGPGESWAWTNKDDEPARVNLLDTLIGAAVHAIRQSHRRNFISWQTWIFPTIERTMTLEIAAGGVAAKGKVFHFKHLLDIDKGTALTTIKIACSKVPEGGTQDPTTAPASPDTIGDYVEPPDNTLLETRLGARDDVLPYDENWNGYTGNYEIAIGNPDGTQFYPRRFQVIGPDIEDNAREEIVADQIQTIEILVPDDTLTVTA